MIRTDSEIYKLDVVNNSIEFDVIDKEIDIEFKEMNAIELLIPKGLKGIKHISSAAGEMQLF